MLKLNAKFRLLTLPVIAASVLTTGLGAILFSLPADAMEFRISAIGYHPQGAKVAILEDVPEDKKVDVVLFDPTRRNPKFPVLLGAPVYKIENIRMVQDESQQGPVTRHSILDFSAFKTPGQYEIRVEGTDLKSPPVKIGEYLYWDLLKPVIKAFYFQRCGQEVEERTLKVYHAPCHLKDADFLTPPKHALDGDEGMDVVGGWHNGGDYAKYVTSTALSAARLIAMNEWDPKPFKYFRLEYPLFEPGYGSQDDLHHEIKAGLDWLISIQRPDGALYRKVAGKSWPGKVDPEEDEQARYIYGVSTRDTANAAATWAMAARDFRKVDLGYSVKSLLAAEKAWAFLEAHPNALIQQGSSDASGSGEFIDPDNSGDMAQRLWAAAELFIVTGKEPYNRYFVRHVNNVPLQSYSWKNPSIQGIIDYIAYAKNPDGQVVANLTDRVVQLADSIMGEMEMDLYSVGLHKYGPSSNQEVAERGAVLLCAYRISGEAKYRDAASRLVGYFFGMNPLGMTYITGQPGKSVEHPAHRWMAASEKVIPGYLVDGPNDFAKDGKTPDGRGASSYVDDEAAQSVNEPKLLNNASIAYFLALLNDAYNASPKEEVNAPKSLLDYKLAPERPGKGKKR